MAFIRVSEGASITDATISENIVVGGKGDSVFLDLGINASLARSTIAKNSQISSAALNQLAALKAGGISKQSAIKRVLTGMGHIADFTTVGTLLGEFWDALK
jgi:hypothetical protein